MKSIFSALLGLVTFVCLLTGNYQEAMLTFGLGASMIKPGTILGLYAVPCELGTVTTNDDCGTKGGIASAYWAKYDDIDWVAMAADPLQWSASLLTILDYTMVGATSFKKIDFDVNTATYDFTFTEEADVYDQLVKLIFEGKSAAQSKILRSTIGCCKIVLHIIDINGLERVVGVEWDGTAFVKQLKTLRIGRHLDTSGQLGQSRARDEMDLLGKSIRAPLFATVGGSNIPIV